MYVQCVINWGRKEVLNDHNNDRELPLLRNFCAEEGAEVAEKHHPPCSTVEDEAKKTPKIIKRAPFVFTDAGLALFYAACFLNRIV